MRDLAEIVRETVPGSETEYGGARDPDPRSYRVDFGKLEGALPELALEWSARKGAVQLYDAYREAGLTFEQFKGRASPGSSACSSSARRAGSTTTCAGRNEVHRARVPGAYLVGLERIEDERGYFARTFCRQEFAEHDLETEVVQANTAFNRRAGTLRGLHFQAEPHAETKLIRCTRGAVYDVIVDLRPGSATFTRWVGVELTAENDAMLYVPVGSRTATRRSSTTPRPRT